MNTLAVARSVLIVAGILFFLAGYYGFVPREVGWFAGIACFLVMAIVLPQLRRP